MFLGPLQYILTMLINFSPAIFFIPLTLALLTVCCEYFDWANNKYTTPDFHYVVNSIARVFRFLIFHKLLMMVPCNLRNSMQNVRLAMCSRDICFALLFSFCVSLFPMVHYFRKLSKRMLEFHAQSMFYNY